MLLNLNKVNWGQSLKIQSYEDQTNANLEALKKFKRLTTEYKKWIDEENKSKSEKEFAISSVGKLNPKA